MDKDLYIEFLESEIRRIRADANTHYGQSIGWMDEMEDLKLENDRLKQRDSIMLNFIKSIDYTDRSCIRCLAMGENGACRWTLFPYRVEMVNDVLKKLEDL